MAMLDNIKDKLAGINLKGVGVEAAGSKGPDSPAAHAQAAYSAELQAGVAAKRHEMAANSAQWGRSNPVTPGEKRWENMVRQSRGLNNAPGETPLPNNTAPNPGIVPEDQIEIIPPQTQI